MKDHRGAVRGMRQRLKITMAEFAKMAGCSASLVYSFESGRRTPKPELMANINRAILAAVVADCRRNERLAAERTAEVKGFLKALGRS